MINCFQNAVPIIYVFDISIFLIFLIFYNIFKLSIVFRTWCPGNPDCDDPKMLCQDLVDDYHSYQVKILQGVIFFVVFIKPLSKFYQLLLVSFTFHQSYSNLIYFEATKLFSFDFQLRQELLEPSRPTSDPPPPPTFSDHTGPQHWTFTF